MYSKNFEEKLEGWRYEEKVSGVDLPDAPDAMRRIDLSISWGEREREQFTLSYFVKSPLPEALNALGGLQ